MQGFKRLFSEGFQFFFLAATLFAIAVIAVWEVSLAGDLGGLDLMPFPIAPAPMGWHAHEMIFGFATAALGGFFLTAVPNWTGTKAAQQMFIASVAGFWFVGRLAVWFSGVLPPALVALAALSFVPVLGAKIASQLLKRPKPQNMMFLGILAALWGGELLVQAEWMGLGWGDAARGLRVGLLAVCAMIAVIGGRITPAFTRNAMVRLGRETGLPDSPKPLDVAGIASAMILPLALLFGLPDMISALIACLAGAAALGRLAFWHGSWTRPFPILWTMHLSYGVLGLGYLAFGFSGLGLGDEIPALHLLGIGAVGGMVLSVMTRASLGHTGRPLIAPREVIPAFALIPVAAVLRWSVALAPSYNLEISLVAGALWLIAFGLAARALWPILTEPRLPRA